MTSLLPCWPARQDNVWRMRCTTTAHPGASGSVRQARSQSAALPRRTTSRILVRRHAPDFSGATPPSGNGASALMQLPEK